MILSYAELLVMIILTSLSQILIKAGSGKIVTERGIGLLIKSFLNPYLIIGTALVLVAPFLYFSALSRLDLNAAFSFNGLGYILVIILGRFVLKEKITALHIAGGLFILTGFVIWNMGAGLF